MFADTLIWLCKRDCYSAFDPILGWLNQDVLTGLEVNAPIVTSIRDKPKNSCWMYLLREQFYGVFLLNIKISASVDKLNVPELVLCLSGNVAYLQTLKSLNILNTGFLLHISRSQDIWCHGQECFFYIFSHAVGMQHGITMNGFVNIVVNIPVFNLIYFSFWDFAFLVRSKPEVFNFQDKSWNVADVWNRVNVM